MIICEGVFLVIVFGMVIPLTVLWMMLAGWYFGPDAYLVSMPFAMAWLIFKVWRLEPPNDEDA